MENENELMDEGDERAFNVERLTRVNERDLMPALDVLDRLQAPRLGRRWRELRMRRVGSDIYMPRERLRRRG
jgi:hypothetical protein